jgi:DNA-binding transcriptional LysR family regulator
MELRHLRYFVAVAEALNFGRAARRLAISQPPLSRQIRALEEELGTALFERTRKAVALTAAGGALLPEARRLLREADALKEGARHLAAGEAGTVALGFISVAAYNILPALVPEFRRRHPGLRLALQEGVTDVLLPALVQGEIDVGMVLPPVAESRLRYRPLVYDRLMVALPATARARLPRGPLPLAALAGQPFILFPRKAGPGLYDLIIGACQRASFSPRVEQEAIQMQTIVSLVAAGMGVALVPASLQHLRRTGVEYRPLKDKTARVEIGLAWRASDESPAVRAFVAIAAECGGRMGQTGGRRSPGAQRKEDC